MTETKAIEQTWIAYLISRIRRKKKRLGLTWDQVEIQIGYSQNHLHRHLKAWEKGKHGMTLYTAARFYKWVRYE